MASDDDILLRELRAVFQGELADHLESLERGAAVLARPDLGEERAQETSREIYRAAHSLKGAARAVGFDAVERLCHHLEERLGPVRRGGVLDATEIREVVEDAVGHLRAWEREHRGESSAPATEVRSAVEASAPPAPATGETVRVSSQRIGALQRLTEEVLAHTAEGRALAGTFAAIDDNLLALRRRLQDARRRLGDPAAVSDALDSAEAVLQTLSLWSKDLERRERVAWAGLSRRIGALNDETRSLRSTRLDTLAPFLERTAFEAARDLGKTIELELSGGDAELDRRLVERLRDPLGHLLRNAVDHGIESPEERQRSGKPAAGRIAIEARLSGTELSLTVIDDGRGIDVEEVLAAAAERGIEFAAPGHPLDLLFEPGFSTRAEATGTSGRGVGLDVVRQRVSELHGRVSMESSRRLGTRVRVVVPGDLSSVRGLVVGIRGSRFVLVETAVERVCRVHARDEVRTEGRRYARVDGAVLPLADLARTLGLAGRAPEGDGPRPAVVLAVGERRMVYLVDALLDSRAVVVKPLGRRVRRVAFIAGATSLGGGELACVLDAAELAEAGRAERLVDTPSPRQRRRPRLLVVDDSVTTRQLLCSILGAAGYDCEAVSDGEVAWVRLGSGDEVDLVVTDVEMPRLDGFQLLARMRSAPRTSSIPVVLVTALSSDDDRQRAAELGAEAYVVKGRFDQTALLDAVEELLP